MTLQMYYLSSLDSVRFEPVRQCHFERRLVFDSGKVAFEARLSPVVIGQDFSRGSDIESVIVVARHEGVELDSIENFPCFVFIAIPHDEHVVLRSPMRTNDLQIIGWGELYRTRGAAGRHAFD